MKQQAALPKMSHKQAKIFWKSISIEDKQKFNDMYKLMLEGKLKISSITVNEREEVQKLFLEPKDVPGKSIKPFAKHFKVE